MRRFSSSLYIVIFFFVIGLFFYRIFLGFLPVPADTLVGLYHPWRDAYASEYPRGIPFKNFLITDPVRQQIPWKKIAIDEWKQGRIPGWNPFTFSGTTLAGNIQAAVFYPLNILFFVFSFPTAWTILVVVQPVLAGVLLYLYLAHKKLHPIACVTGALSWSMSGFSIAWLTWGTILQTAMWLPLILLAIDKIAEGKRAWWIWLSFGVIFLSLAGHAQIALYSFLCAVGYTWYRWKNTQLYRGLWRDALLSACIVGALTAVQWWPFITAFKDSARSVEVIWQKDGFFLPWQHSIQFIAPDFFGNPATLNYWGVWNWAELVGYVGIVSLLLAFIALFQARGYIKFWMSIVIISLVFAWPTPLAKLPYLWDVPIFSSLQPTRLLMLVDLGLAILAAFGMHMLFRKPRIVVIALGGGLLMLSALWVYVYMNLQKGVDLHFVEQFMVARRNLLLPSVYLFATVAIVGMGFRWVKLQKLSMLLLVAILSFDLLRFGWKVTPFTPIEYFFPETKVITFLQQLPKPFRVVSMDERILPPNVSSFYGIETIEGYDPLYSARYETFFAALTRNSFEVSPPYGFNRILTTKTIDSPLLSYTNAEYILSLEELDRPFLTKVFQEGETRVYKNTHALRRVYLAEHIEEAQQQERIFYALMTSEMSHLAMVEESVPGVDGSNPEEETATISSYGTQHITIETTTKGKRVLVVLNQYDAGWKAEIDGVEASVLRVNYTFSGIIVPEGTHTISLVYR